MKCEVTLNKCYNCLHRFRKRSLFAKVTSINVTQSKSEIHWQSIDLYHSIWFNSLTDTSFPETTIRSSINGIIKEFGSLPKSKKRPGFSEKIQIFEMKKYVFPNRQSNPRKRKLDSVVKDSSNETLKSVNMKIAKDLNDSIEINEQIKLENEEMCKEEM